MILIQTSYFTAFEQIELTDNPDYVSVLTPYVINLDFVFKLPVQTLFATKQELFHQCCGNKSFDWRQLYNGCRTTAKHNNVLGVRSFHS